MSDCVDLLMFKIRSESDLERGAERPRSAKGLGISVDHACDIGWKSRGLHRSDFTPCRILVAHKVERSCELHLARVASGISGKEWPEKTRRLLQLADLREQHAVSKQGFGPDFGVGVACECTVGLFGSDDVSLSTGPVGHRPALAPHLGRPSVPPALEPSDGAAGFASATAKPMASAGIAQFPVLLAYPNPRHNSLLAPVDERRLEARHKLGGLQPGETPVKGRVGIGHAGNDEASGKCCAPGRIDLMGEVELAEIDHNSGKPVDEHWVHGSSEGSPGEVC